MGDNLFNIFLFNKLKKYIEENNIIIEYYCNKNYNNEIIDMKNSNNIIIYDFKPLGYHLHFLNKWNFNTYFFIFKTAIFLNQKTPYDIIYKDIFNKFLIDHKIPIQFDNFYNEDDSILTDYNDLPDKYHNIDILIINSIPLSNQIKVDENEWTNFLINLNNKYKIVTTRKVENILCTWDDKLTVKKIAAISAKAKVIIAINTGPATAIFNTFTINNCRRIYILDIRVKFTTIPQLENIDTLKEINLDNIHDIIIKNNI